MLAVKPKDQTTVVIELDRSIHIRRLSDNRGRSENPEV
jgi:hypothetical protein